MRILLLSLGLLLLIPGSSRANSILRDIDNAYRSGAISEGQRLFYRVAAVKAPHLLPMRFAGVTRSGQSMTHPWAQPSVRSHFRVMLEAFRSLDRVEPALRRPLHDLLLPPPDLTYSIDSTALYPIRVSYGLPSHAAKAQRVMEVAELVSMK